MENEELIFPEKLNIIDKPIEEWMKNLEAIISLTVKK